MRRTPFIVWMSIEFFVALICMGWMYSDMGALIYLVASTIFAVVLAPFFVWLKLTPSEAKKGMIRRLMVFIMLIPITIALLPMTVMVAALFLYYA